MVFLITEIFTGNGHDGHRVTYHNQSWHRALGGKCNLSHTCYSHSSCNSHSPIYWSTSSHHCCYRLGRRLRGGAWGKGRNLKQKVVMGSVTWCAGKRAIHAPVAKLEFSRRGWGREEGRKAVYPCSPRKFNLSVWKVIRNCWYCYTT